MRAKTFLAVLGLGMLVTAWVACGSAEDSSSDPAGDRDGGPESDGSSGDGGAGDTGGGDTGGGDTGGGDTASLPPDAAEDAPATKLVVYSNDFETNTAGFDVTDTASLPSTLDGGASTYLGRRSPASTNAVLTLTGLTPGKTYELAFDLYIGGTWDGSKTFGPDVFTVTSSSSGVLVSATFANAFPIGDPAPRQSYSDDTPLGDAPDGGLFRTREGADIELGEAVYYFGHGAKNPILTFKPKGASETITFHSQDAQSAGDEFFALDNVVVTTAP